MIYQLIGLGLFALGFSHKLIPLSRLDHGVVKYLQEKLGQPPFLAWFKEIWFFGRTTFAMILLVLLTCFNWKLGLSALAVLGITSGIEKLVKISFFRSRPFSDYEDIQMLQPREPVDPAFPSGDAMRIWFLALIISIALGNNLLFGIISILLAVVVSLGRMILGVHFLSDVLAGAGLGCLGAGTTIWLWQILQLL